MEERIRILLGPATPELTCEDCFEQLPAYVELEVVPGREFELCPTCVSPAECRAKADCLGMLSHLDGCPACAEEHETLRALVLADGAA